MSVLAYHKDGTASSGGRHPSILCVGFPESDLAWVEEAIRSTHFRPTWADTHKKALGVFEGSSIVLLNLGWDDAIRTARALRACRGDAMLIGIVGGSERRVTAEAVRAGVIEIARKPLRGPELAAVIQRVQDVRATSMARPYLCSAPDSVFVRSAGMRRAMSLAARASASAGIVMIGEPGTGREFLARTIHRFGGQECDNFIVVDCAANSRQGVEAELFGTLLDVVGSPSHDYLPLNTSSAFHRARGGTLFIKNIREMSPRVRLRLARGLERRRNVDQDIRLVLSAEATYGDAAWADFCRSTMFERIEVPPLRERREDIPLLANRFLEQIGAAARVTPKILTPAAATLLAGLRWRGNADELETLLEQVVTQVPGEVIRFEDIVEALRSEGGTSAAATATLRMARAQFEQEYVRSVLEAHNGQVREAARVLGIQRTNLYRKLRRLRVGVTRESQTPVVRVNNLSTAATSPARRVGEA